MTMWEGRIIVESIEVKPFFPFVAMIGGIKDLPEVQRGPELSVDLLVDVNDSDVECLVERWREQSSQRQVISTLTATSGRQRIEATSRRLQVMFNNASRSCY